MKTIMEMSQTSANKKRGDEVATKAIDPVCGMKVDPSEAAGSYEYNGQTYYFCSTSCLYRFQENPERFMQKREPTVSQPVGIQRGPTAAIAPVLETYTCPMHPELSQDKPGSCPTSGVALKNAIIAGPRGKVEYTCPMHPQIIRDGPGNCPICGMALEPRTVSLER